MEAIDKIIFGDNQFFGINHMSQEKAQQLAEEIPGPGQVERQEQVDALVVEFPDHAARHVHAQHEDRPHAGAGRKEAGLQSDRFGDRDMLHEQAAKPQQGEHGQNQPQEPRAQRLQQRELGDG